MTGTTFANIGLKPELLSNLATLNYHYPTPIQALSLPRILEAKDVLAQAKTGSGKTAAFGLALLQKLNAKSFLTQALVLCPTRELSDQVANEIRILARTIPNVKILTLYGGIAFGVQLASLNKKSHIIVGTPGRILDHLQKRTLNLDTIQTLVLDEADRMLDMGFIHSLEEIISYLPSVRQTLLFSATFTDEIKKISQEKMHNPVMVITPEVHSQNTIKQEFYEVRDDEHRLEVLKLLLLQYASPSSLIFCNTKKDAQVVYQALKKSGFSVLALHGDLEQKDRDQTLIRFSNKSIAILVATDVAARGLDIQTLDLVVNYYISHDAQTHTHRIGRTGRSGKQGIACTLFSQKEQHKINNFDLGLSTKSEDNIKQYQQPLPEQNLLNKVIQPPKVVTLRINGGKKQKLRAGDIVGALTKDGNINQSHIGKINIIHQWSYVAIKSQLCQPALDKLNQYKLKGKTFRAKRIT